jgi:hypothetical protein
MGIAGNARLSVDAKAAMPSLAWVGQLVDEGI